MKDLEQMNMEVFKKLHAVVSEFVKRMEMPKNSDQDRYTFDTVKKLHMIHVGAAKDFTGNMVLVDVLFGAFEDAAARADNVSGPTSDIKGDKKYVLGLEFSTYTDAGCKSSVSALPISPETLDYVDECCAMLKTAIFGYLGGQFEDRAKRYKAAKAAKASEQGSKSIIEKLRVLN